MALVRQDQSQRTRTGRALLRPVLGATAAVCLATTAVPALAGTASISGHAWRDADRDGVMDAGEQPLSDQVVFLFDAQGNRVDGVVTDASGRYSFAVGGGTYTVRYGESSWRALWDSWVPTTTGTERPERTVTASASAVVDFGWRPITRSTDIARPLSQATGPEGLRVLSYTDAVDATSVASALTQGSGVGAEAASTVVRFGLGDRSYCATSLSGAPGAWTGQSADCYVDYRSWLEQKDAILFHEYGHAWSGYHEHVTQQDGDWSSYLAARGLAGDPRIGSGYAWYPEELIAEDYRQLLGSPTARAMPQSNSDIPAAEDVPGLADFLRSTYTTSRASAGGTAPAVALVSPSDGSTVAGSVSLVAEARDDRDTGAALSVDIAVDGGAWRRAAYDAKTGRYALGWDSTTVADGTHSLTVRAVDSAGHVGAAAPVAFSVRNSPARVAVGDLDGSTTASKSGWTAAVSVRVDVVGGGALRGAAVTIGWLNAKGSSVSATCTTGSDGRCSVSTSFAKSLSSRLFTVQRVTASGHTYDAPSNGDPDGDSDGTTIAVSRPG